MEKKAVIIGCSSGIGRALALNLSREGYFVGLAGRDPEKLRSLQAELPGRSLVQRIDVRETDGAMRALEELISQMGGLDLLVINAGVLFHNQEFIWKREEETIKVNAMGFAAMANVGLNHFLKQGSGTLVGISSVACHRGSGRSPSYNASKSFMSNYLEGLRQKVSGSPVRVIDVRPGFVDTDMIRGRKGLFGVAPADEAAEAIFSAIRKGKRIAYVPGWWAAVMWFFKRTPEWLYHFGYRKYAAWDKGARPQQPF